MLEPQFPHNSETAFPPRSAALTDVGSGMPNGKAASKFFVSGWLARSVDSDHVSDESQIEVRNLLDAPDLNARVGGIENRFDRTLEWVFELQEFTTWLQRGTGIFWIRGKPGSGKSTLMKFINQSNKTWDLVHDVRRGGHEISASFYFHFRGSVMQKSFEGVLRSLLKQILTEVPELTMVPGVFEALDLARKSLLERRIPHLEEGGTQGSAKYGPRWTVPVLERCLTAIIEQQTLKLDMCLFFDALDEFDGHHSLICNFLERLVNPEPTSLTRVKVCFSSRPWEIFEASFSKCPGFRLQDHTQDDIRDYCLSSLSRVASSVPYIEKLVPDIIAKAAGVFLWVKLVLGQLASEHSRRTALALTDMRSIIGSLPTELDEFYNVILQRIPPPLRWQTYALLETLIRSDDSGPSDLETSTVTSAVLLSTFPTYYEAVKARCQVAEQEQRLLVAKWSGGLAEIVDQERGTRVQLMHQTVHDFATNIKFKERILGDRAKITHENGHTFHAKSRLVRFTNLEFLPLKHHLLKAEATTGRSIYSFLDGIPVDVVADMVDINIRNPKGLSSFVSLTAADAYNAGPQVFSLLATSFELQLLIRDLAAKDPSVFLHPRAGLLECLFRGGGEAKYETAALLLEVGYTPVESIGVLWAALWAGSRGPTSFSPDEWEKLERLERDFAALLVERGWDTSKNITISELRWTSEAVGYRSSDCSCSLLHFALPELTKWLLARGFDPNSLDDDGHTPLDWLLQDRWFPQSHWHAEKARALADAGGRPTTTKKKLDRITALKFLPMQQVESWTREGWIYVQGQKHDRTMLRRLKDKLVRRGD